MSTTNDATKRALLLDAAKAQAIAAPVMAQIAEILRHPAQHLSPIESQRRFIIEMHLLSPECPWCDSHVSYFEAIPESESESESASYVLGSGCDTLTCPHCKKRVRNCVPLMSVQPWYWGKLEEDKNPSRVQRGVRP